MEKENKNEVCQRTGELNKKEEMKMEEFNKEGKYSKLDKYIVGGETKPEEPEVPAPAVEDSDSPSIAEYVEKMLAEGKTDLAKKAKAYTDSVVTEDADNRYFIPDVKAEPLIIEGRNEATIYFNHWDYKVSLGMKDIRYACSKLQDPMDYICGFDVSGFKNGMVKLYFNPITHSESKKTEAIGAVLYCIKQLHRSYYNPNSKPPKTAKSEEKPTAKRSAS